MRPGRGASPGGPAGHAAQGSAKGHGEGMAGRQEWRGSWVAPSRAADAQRRPTGGVQ